MFEKFKGLFKKSPVQYPSRPNNYIIDRDVRSADTPNDLRRIDGWGNALTGLGMYGQDKSLASVATWNRMIPVEAAAIYASDPLAKKIVNHVVESALIHDYRFVIGDKEEDFNIKFNKERKERIDKKFKIKEIIYEAATWARVFGSAYLVIGADDGNAPDAPLNLKTLKKIDWIKAFDVEQVYPMIGSFDPNSTNFLNPEYYTLATYGGSPANTVYIHHSRVIRFDGKKLLRRLYIQNGYRHDSVLNPIRSILSNYNHAIGALGVMIQEWSIGIIKIPGIAQAIASGKEDLVTKRVSIIDKCKSVIRSVIIGKDEEYQRMSSQYNGVDNVAQFLRKELATHVDIPHTILFNEGPSSGSFGLGNSSGDSEMTDWQAIVGQYQKHYLKDQLMQLYRILFSDQSNTLTKGKVPKFDIEFSAARSLSREDEAQIYSDFAGADSAYINMGVLTPMEVRQSRFSDTGPFKDLDTRIELSDETVLESQEESESEGENSSEYTEMTPNEVAKQAEKEENEDEEDDKPNNSEKKSERSQAIKNIKNSILGVRNNEKVFKRRRISLYR